MTKTKIDDLFKSVEQNKKVFTHREAKRLEIPIESVNRIARYLEKLGLVELDFKHLNGPAINYVKSPEHPFRNVSFVEIVNKLKFYKSIDDIDSANKLVYSLYEHAKKVDEKHITNIYQKVKNLHLTKGKYVVGSGSALEGYGIRKSNDIDIVVTKDVYLNLKKKGWKETIFPNGLTNLTKEKYEVMVNFNYGK